MAPPSAAQLNQRATLTATELSRTMSNKQPLNHQGSEDTVTPGDESTKLIGIEGKWYDITSFISRHPGGPIIKSLVGRDATTLFHAFHRNAPTLLKHRQPVGRYTLDCTDNPTYQAFEKLRRRLEADGFYTPDLMWYAGKVVLAVIFLTIAVCLIAGLVPLGEWARMGRFAGAIFLAAFWQQCGFLMHDCMHAHLTRHRATDHALGRFFGTACLGISATWWRDEHFVHHALTNSVDHETNFVDPQMHETTWAQDKALFPLVQGFLGRLAVRFQYISFLPLCVVAGRTAITFDSFTSGGRSANGSVGGKEGAIGVSPRPPIEWLAGAIHWAAVAVLFSQIPDYREAACVYFLASCAQGILHIQLLLSHYIRPFVPKDEMASSGNWYERQVGCTIDILNPWWLDWFHGGLNFHVAHHLFPTMPRHSYRRATELIKKTCEEVGVVYRCFGWSDAVCQTLVHLKTMSYHFSLDPR